MRFSNPGLAKRRPRIGRGRKPASQKKQRVDIVTTCDRCGKPLCRTCARTSGSYACACGDGVWAIARFSHTPEDGEPRMVYRYYCSKECKEAAG